MNSDPHNSSNLEESKENKADISREIEIPADDVKKSKLNESDDQVIRVLQNSNADTGKYKLLDHSVIFEAIRSLYATC